MKMQSAECAKRMKGETMDTFHLTRETETDRLKCIYTAWIEVWMVDDWTRIKAVHLNHHLLMMVICLSFYPYANTMCLLLSYKLFALTLLERMILHRRELNVGLDRGFDLHRL